MILGLIGHGVVGSAVASAFEAIGHKVLIYDKYKYTNAISNLLNTELIFVCVPTPTQAGEQNLEALHDVLRQLHNLHYSNPVVIKSTVVPGTCDGLSKIYSRLKLIHNPEFLTQRNAFVDFMNQRVILLSGLDSAALAKTVDIYKALFKNADVNWSTDFKVTELAKYVHNVFLASKVAIMNEFYEYCQKLSLDYDQVIEFALSQGGVGEGHTRVPGPDGKLGFGGACFIKDTMALLNDYTQVGIHAEVLLAVIAQNKRIRPEAYDGTEKTGIA